MNTRDPNPELTRLERLAALLRDDGVDVDAMNRDQLEQYLKDNKVDMAAPQKRFNTILKKAEARRRLEIAHQTGPFPSDNHPITTAHYREGKLLSLEKYPITGTEETHVWSEADFRTADYWCRADGDIFCLRSDQSLHQSLHMVTITRRAIADALCLPINKVQVRRRLLTDLTDQKLFEKWIEWITLEKQ